MSNLFSRKSRWLCSLCDRLHSWLCAQCQQGNAFLATQMQNKRLHLWFGQGWGQEGRLAVVWEGACKQRKKF